ncbi:MAG: hypothetical protein IPG08_17490 [Sphingobacteriaceae bacterium]|nr:hypothetical protein [Sphingobacteriaceae bacterium]
MTSNPSSQANPLMFRKSGAGTNPLIRAFSPVVSTSVDGILILNGCDNVTIHGIDLAENPGNSTPTQLMEFGYALVKVSGTNGCWNNTIKNCSVTLSNANPASIGIYIGNHTATNITGLTVSNISGTSSNNKFYNNSLQNCYDGYSFTGYATAVPFDFTIKIILLVLMVRARRSQVVKFGGSAVQANGIFATNQNALKIHSTYINNSVAPLSTGPLYGIALTGGTNSNLDVYRDTITLALNSATDSQLTGISCAMGNTGAGNTVNIYNNLITGCTYPTNTSGILELLKYSHIEFQVFTATL